MFYRVQDEQGIGPYQNPAMMGMMYSHGGDVWNHPSPYYSGQHCMKPEQVCAFKSMNDLFRWFGGFLPLLLKNGYSVVKVDGILKYEDSFQVVIIPIP